MNTCEKKDVGTVKSAVVCDVLPDAVFTLCQISMMDPRFDGMTPRYVWALEMTAEEWDKLYLVLFPEKVAA